LIEIINKQLLLQLVCYLCYWQMGFNSVFKGLKSNMSCLSRWISNQHKSLLSNYCRLDIDN